MTEIAQDKGVVTQITTVELPSGKQDEVLNLMKQRARFMATQPGFVSINLHRSKDGTHVVNYIQWRDADTLAAAHHSPEFRKKWPQFGKIAEDTLQCPYHGFRYGITGRCVRVPSQTAIIPELAVRSYPIVEKGGFIWLWPGAAEFARSRSRP